MSFHHSGNFLYLYVPHKTCVKHMRGNQVLYRQRVMENGCCGNPGKLIAQNHVSMRYQEKLIT